MTTELFNCPAEGRSLMRSLKRKKNSRPPGSTAAKVSGMVSITTGGVRSSGPPGGVSGLAQVADASANRKVPHHRITSVALPKMSTSLAIL